MWRATLNLWLHKFIASGLASTIFSDALSIEKAFESGFKFVPSFHLTIVQIYVNFFFNSTTTNKKSFELIQLCKYVFKIDQLKFQNKKPRDKKVK